MIKKPTETFPTTRATSKQNLSSTQTRPDPTLLSLIHTALSKLKAQKITELPIGDISSVADLMVVASGSSTTHVKAIAEEIIECSKKHTYKPLGVEGIDAAEWVLVDLGDIIVHIMLPQTRVFYDLERLWTARPTSTEPTH